MDYRTKTTLLGLPLIHIAVGPPADGRAVRGVARGWIAVGDLAVGPVLAIGGGAVGGIAVGGVGAGLISLGGLSVGGFALGGAAVGIFSAGGMAIAWRAAIGGLAVAHDYALGGAAVATHANDAAARGYFQAHPVMTAARFIMDHARWGMIGLVLPVGAGIIGARRRKRELKRTTLDGPVK